MKSEEKWIGRFKGKKLLPILPFAIVPLLALCYWFVINKKDSQEKVSPTGLNIHLPDAQLKDEVETKWRLYEKAERDSGVNNNTPFNELNFELSKPKPIDSTTSLYNPYPLETAQYNNPEQKVYEKLAEIDRQIKTTPVSKDSKQSNPLRNMNGISERTNSKTFPEADSDKDSEDPELKQINDLIEKVLDVQHPERVQKQMEEMKQERVGERFAVLKTSHKATISHLGDLTNKSDYLGFHPLQKHQTFEKDDIDIRAEIFGDQIIQNGSMVRLKLLSNVSIQGVPVSKNQLVYGTASINGERLSVTIGSLRSQNNIYPVKMKVYDIDGVPGIYVPNLASEEVAKSSLNNTAQMLRLSSLDPSLKTQAADAGLDAVKVLLRKKSKSVKVRLKSGYKVYLYNKD